MQLPRPMPANFREIELRVYSIGQQEQQLPAEEKQQLKE